MATLQGLEKKMDQKFAIMDQRFAVMDQKFEKMFQKVFDTIDHLAMITKEGFDRVNEKFDQVDKRFDGIDFHLDVIKNISIGGHERRIENVEDNIRVIKTKLKLV